MRLTTQEQLRQAERDDNIHLIKVLCYRLDYIIRDGKCPHCDSTSTGLGAWPNDITDADWNRLLSEPVPGLPYICGATWLPGCNKYFISVRTIPVQPNPTA